MQRKEVVMKRKMFAALVAGLLFSVLLVSSSFALTQDEIDRMTGPGNGITADQFRMSMGLTGPEELGNAVKNEDSTYSFEGKKYIAEESWGIHCLTGFCPNADGSRRTRSGKDAAVWHTVSGPSYMLGKVVLVKAVSGPGENYNRYNGIYVFEDTGGTAVEYGLPTTMNVPVVDIFRETPQEAEAVSADGWIKAEIIVLKEVAAPNPLAP